MLFAVIGHFRPGVEAERQKAHEAFNDHIAQHGPRIRLGGGLKDAQGARSGVMLLVEAEDAEAVRRFIEASPYHLAGLYARIDVDRLDVEVGSLG